MWHHTNRCQNSLIILKIDWIDVQLQNRLHQRIQNIKIRLKYISRNSEIDRWYISNANTPTSVSKSRGGDDAQITSVSEIDHIVTSQYQNLSNETTCNQFIKVCTSVKGSDAVVCILRKNRLDLMSSWLKTSDCKMKFTITSKIFKLSKIDIQFNT